MNLFLPSVSPFPISLFNFSSVYVVDFGGLGKVRFFLSHTLQGMVITSVPRTPLSLFAFTYPMSLKLFDVGFLGALCFETFSVVDVGLKIGLILVECFGRV
jgi:hypothetical protein